MAADDLKLVDPTTKLKASYLAMVAEFRAAGETYHENEWALAICDFGTLVDRLKESARGVDLPDGAVPQNTFWLVRGATILGYSRFRRRLVPHLEHEGGHIGYIIRPSERRKGYATRLLALTLDKARAQGLPRALVTCDVTNVASNRVIRTNAGQLEDTRISVRTGKPVNRYWIDLPAHGRPK